MCARRSAVSITAVATLLIGGGRSADSALAQELDLEEIFTHRSFYEQHRILDARGDVPFLADVWYLPGAADSTRLLVGISLSNEALQFVRTSEGRWQANYEVILALEAEAGSSPPESRWEKSVEVATFDETLLPGETIVFQSQLGVLPGPYELRLTVRDRNADDAANVSTEIEVPPFGGGTALSEPVLLRLYEPGATDGYVVNPSHYYESAPQEFDFLVEVAGVPAENAPYTLSARVVSAAEEAAPVGSWRDSVTPEADGTTRVFGTVTNDGARFGEYELEIELADGSGRTVADARTGLLVAGSGGWIAENWDDALSLIKYEATEGEIDILEDIEGDEQRIQAWNCFWAMRDPAPATLENEALQDYFRRIQIANREWRSALRPGYLSDRGRVFITLGPPDEIVERPVPSGPTPFEIWVYHRYNFRIEFVDRIGFNNYELANLGTYQRELSVIQRRKHDFLEERAETCPLLAPAFR